jgi:hypothetical protein
MAVGLVTVALTLATEVAMARPDPHGLVLNSNGAARRLVIRLPSWFASA